ncbi:MAG: response regulator transcription factor [Spirochaetia bacterium]|nr:response regulator transcription factor [Spirochaetia bacterium]MCF7953784.1 response regulator transcription factor [Spirochaetales bacterium]
MISVAIVDDHQLVRTGLKTLLEDIPDIEVTADFSGGTKFLSEYSRLQNLDVLLLDISMPDITGMEVLTQILDQPNAPAVIFLTVYPEESYAQQAISAGAKGYLTKNCSRETLIQAITSVAHGGIYISNKTRELLFMQNAKEPLTPPPEKDLLSSQELTVFTHICKGLTIKEISFTMNLSPKSVSTYKTRVMEKLHVKNLAELIRIGISWGLS